MNELERMLERERGDLQRELEEIRAKIAEAEKRLTVVIQRLRHVDGLLGFEDNSGSLSQSLELAAGEVSRPQPAGESITDLAERVLLEQQGKPMYYKELAREVQRLGGQIGGREPGAALVAKLVTDDRFVRPTSKGFYGLRHDFPTARNVGARLRPKRRRSRHSQATVE